MSVLGEIYQSAYDKLCGKHPDYYPWHFQWLFLRDTHQWQKKCMQNFSGHVLDVGCGSKPYKVWVKEEKVDKYIGLDVLDGPEVDVVVEPGKSWPIEDSSIDCVLLTQVLEHVTDKDFLLNEINRVLKPGGTIVVTVPFLYPVHGYPYDYVRFTENGLTVLLEDKFETEERVSKGGIGCVLASLLLTWLDTSFNSNLVTRMLKGILLPIWVVFSLIVNIFSWMLDKIDTTGTHYANVCWLGRKKS